MKQLIFYLCILLLPAMVSAETSNCSTCAGCNIEIQDATDGDTVQLIADISNHVGSCIEFDEKDNITFDCGNHLIDGNIGGDGISLFSSDGNTIKNCEITGSFFGIHLYTASNNTLENTVTNSNVEGIVLYQSPDNTLTGITSIDNNKGINIITSSSTTISSSHITGNSIGINVHDSNTNQIYNNYFSNTDNINIGTTVSNWNTSETSGTNIVGDPYIGGNYWAYPNGTGFSETCTDSDSDGFCDDPYIINPDNTDYLPLSSGYAKAHTVYGSCMNADDGTPADGTAITVYIESRPDETINDTVGTSGNSGTDNNWTVNIGNLDTAWSIGEIVIIEADNGDGYFDRTAVILTDADSDEAPDMKLKEESDTGYLAIVIGTIYDIDTFTGIADADVYIECINNSKNTTTTSNINGYYMAALPCPMDGTVWVTAIKESIGSGENTGLVEYIGTFGTEVDVGMVHIDVTIPEFPIAALPALLSMFSFGLLRKRLI